MGNAFSEVRKHFYITDLDGPEAASFGEVMACATRILREETGAELVYVYVFGDGVPHLHVHLAPHRKGNALCDQMIRGELFEEQLPSGFTNIISKDFPALPKDELTKIADRVKKRLASENS